MPSGEGGKAGTRGPRKGLGPFGERMAEQFLARRGYRVVQRNHRTRFGEIDLIAYDGDDLVFVEVKARRGVELGSPEESLTRDKQRRLVQLAEAYLQEQQTGDGNSWRIDVVAIQLDGHGKVKSISLYQNAIELG